MKLAACFGVDVEAESLAIVTRMARAQALLPFHTISSVACGRHGAVGCVRTSDQHARIPLARTHANGNALWIAGVPVQLGGGLDMTLEAALDGGIEIAKRSLARLDGVFAILYWDATAEKLLVVSDFMGMRPLYLVRRKGLLLLASELKGIAASGLVDVEIDPVGWGGFVIFFSTIGNVTQLRDTVRIPPASITVYDPARETWETSTYWRQPEEGSAPSLDAVDTGPLVESLEREAAAFSEYCDRSVVLLSGGFDSRLNLALCLKQGIPVRCVTGAHPDERFDLDGKIAARVARRFGIPSEVNALDPGFFSTEAYFAYLAMNEVAYPNLRLFIATVSRHLRPEMQAVWEGCFTGATMRQMQRAPGGFAVYFRRYDTLEENEPWLASERVFHPALREAMREGFIGLLKKTQAEYTQDESGVSRFAIEHRVRTRFALQPHRVYENSALPLCPGMTRPYWETLAQVPMRLRWRGELCLRVFERHYPEFAKIPFMSMPLGLTACSGMNPLFLRYRATQSLRYSPRLGRILSVFKPGFEWKPLTLVDRIIAQVNPDHPDLNAEGVARLQLSTATGDPLHEDARRLLFFWQVWRWVLEGKHEAMRRELFESGA